MDRENKNGMDIDDKKTWLGERMETLLPASYHVYNYLSDVGKRLRNAATIARLVGAEHQSQAAIAELVRLYSPENVAFIHLPQKEEVDNGVPMMLGMRARRAIQEATEHRNSAGYAKIASCTIDVIKKMTAHVQ